MLDDVFSKRSPRAERPRADVVVSCVDRPTPTKKDIIALLLLASGDRVVVFRTVLAFVLRVSSLDVDDAARFVSVAWVVCHALLATIRRARVQGLVA